MVQQKTKVHFIRAGSLLHPELLHQEGPATRLQVQEESRLQRIPHGNSTSKKVSKETLRNIHDRLIRDKIFRKTMIELGRFAKIILEMDRLASEDHRHIAPQEEIDVYRGYWWIGSNVENFYTMPTRHQPDLKKALSTLYRLKKAEDKKHNENWSQSSSTWWQWQATWLDLYYETSPQRWIEHWSNGETCVISQWTNYSFVAWISARIWCTIYRDYIGNSQRSLLSPTGGVKRTSLVTAIREQKWLRKSV